MEDLHLIIHITLILIIIMVVKAKVMEVALL